MRPVTLHTIIRHTGQNRAVVCRPERLSADTARACIRRGRRGRANVRVFETTDRTGTAVHIVHIHFGPGRWRDIDAVTDIYEVPTAALTAV
ncbi:hypothetical protein C9F11_27525 [Streptomyces sp. YIM 121038]|uniref:hypothetical protein n=1 Tax=Streptomyces sp. YIM 121038 TaxID=2136401 RepID=UPI0011108C34|nr:hypothetical protein [Streptomyces sp. YIM 121038]QCX79107.1 hypothetical protein C9F11_27525 [Streptomyces sp. YIM 121038]